jgi:hypothetical protein
VPRLGDGVLTPPLVDLGREIKRLLDGSAYQVAIIGCAAASCFFC